MDNIDPSDRFARKAAIPDGFWHNSDASPWSLYVRCWGQSGKHVLAASISEFDPQETFRSDMHGHQALRTYRANKGIA